MATEHISPKTITINSVGPMGSLDPVEQDALNSTIIFKNVYPRLVSLGSDTTPRPFLADSWHVSRDRLEWTFSIHPGAKFENGELISPEVIGKNLKRVLWLTKNDKSQLHLKLRGFSNWTGLNQPLEGVRWDGQKLTLCFMSPPEELFETLEQALFGVVPLSAFDSKTGKFTANRPISGGYYRVGEIAPDHIDLLRNPGWDTKGPDEIILRWDDFDLNRVNESSNKYDLVITNGMNFTDHFRKIHAGTKSAFVVAPPFLMNFVQLNASAEAFKNAKLRKEIQAAFYAQLFSIKAAKDYFFLSNSFLPKGTPGYKEFDVPTPAPQRNVRVSKTVRLVWWPPSPLQEANELILSSLTEALKSVGIRLDVYRCHDRKEMIEKMRAGDFDVMVRLTGVLIRNPFSDMRLMFQSKMGAVIPDLTGNCAKLLNDADSEQDPTSRRRIAEQINSQVFEDASILTFSHSGFAYIYNRQKMSIDRFNLHNDPFDFTAIDLGSIQ